MLQQCIYATQYRFTQKTIVLQVYSKGKMCCNKCGFDENIDALTIDHIDNKKKEDAGKGYFYTWIIKNNFPNNLQVLCMNCQFIKRLENNECEKPSIYKNSA